MKNFNRKLCLVFILILTAAVLFSVAACGGKKAALHLDAGAGGSIAQAEHEVEVGADLYEYLQGISPDVKEGFIFDGWYDGEHQIASGDTMSESGMSLKAKYDVSYTVNLYISDASGEYGDPTVTKGTARYGEPFAPSIPSPPSHYALDMGKESKLQSAALQPGEVFNIWYRREEILVIYRMNAPAGVEIGGSMPSSRISLGGELTVPACNFTHPADYRFVGWTRSDDETQKRYFAGDRIQNIETGFELQANWQRGYCDLFGGEDVIFPSYDGGNALTLVRGGKTFEGTLREDGSFTFGAGENVLEGKLGENFTFSYFRNEQRGEYSLYDGHLGAEPFNGTKLTLDGLGGAAITDADGTSLSGSYLPLGGESFSFTPVSGSSFIFVLGVREGERIFSIFDGAKGDYLEAVAKSVEGVVRGEKVLSLDGFGGAQLIDYGGGVSESGSYAIAKGDASSLLLTVSFSGLEKTIFTLDTGESLLYLERSEYAGVYREKDGDATLSLDGFAVFGESAVYADGATEKYCPYWLRVSERFGVIADLYEEKEGVLTCTASYLLHEDMTFERFLEEAKELMRLTLISGYASPAYPMLILYGEAYDGDAPEGALKAEICDMGSSDSLETVASGYYTVEVLGGNIRYYKFTAAGSSAAAPFESMEFLTGSVGTSDGGFLDVYYAFYIDGEAAFTRVRAAEGAGELRIMNVGVTGIGGLFFDGKGGVFEGSFSLADIADAPEGNSYYIFTSYIRGEIDGGYEEVERYFCVKDMGGESVFQELDSLPAGRQSVFYLVDEFGEVADQDGGLLVFLGEGRAMYIGAGSGSALYFGAYTDSGRKTVWGDAIYTFTPPEASDDPYAPAIEPFDFILEYGEGTNGYFRIFDAALCGTLTSENGARLELDGFCFRARYTNSYHQTFEGLYILYDAQTIWFRVSETGEEFRFQRTQDGFRDVDEVTEYTPAGVYSICNDSGFSPEGYLGSTLTLEEGGAAALKNASGTPLSRSGKWTKEGETVEVELILTDGSSFIWRCMLLDEKCILFHAEAEGVYAGADLSVLHLDGWGGGTFIDRYGRPMSVTAEWARDDVLILTGTGGQRILVKADAASHTFAQSAALSAAYYTADLTRSLVFADAFYEDGRFMGCYFVEGRYAHLFVKGETRYEERLLELPEGDSYSYGGRTYFRFAGGALTFQGQLTFADGMKDPVPVRLTLKGEGLGLFPAATTLFYGEGSAEVKGGFTARAENGELLLCDARGGSYPLTLTWEMGGTGTAAIEGDFIYYSALYDAETAASNMVYYGYFGVGDVKIGENVWYYDFADVKDTAGNSLRFLTESAPWEMETFGSSNAHGTLYGFELTGKDGELYFAMYFLVDGSLQAWKEGAQTLPDMLIYSVGLCRTLTFTDGGGTKYTLEIEQCFYNNSFKNSFTVGDILDATLLVDGAPVEAEGTEDSGNSLVFAAENGTYTLSLSRGEDGFVQGFSAVFVSVNAQ